MKPNKSLLEKCHATKMKYAKKDTDVDTAIAWLKGEIRLLQLVAALNGTNASAYSFLARSLQLAYQQGKISIKP